MEIKTAIIGDTVKYVDEKGNTFNALVTAVWGNGGCAINLLYVDNDETKTDQYGRQIRRVSSASHQSVMGECPGRYWYWEN